MTTFDSGQRTEEGYPIYTEEELGMSKEGGGMLYSPLSFFRNSQSYWEQILHFARLIVTAVRGPQIVTDYRTVPLTVFL